MNVKGLVFNLKNETTVRKDGKPLRSRKGMIEYDQGKISLVLFGALSDDGENNRYYKLRKKHLKVQKLYEGAFIQVS